MVAYGHEPRAHLDERLYSDDSRLQSGFALRRGCHPTVVAEVNRDAYGERTYSRDYTDGSKELDRR